MMAAMIAQVKFVAAYMVPSLYPAMIAAAGLLASIITPPPETISPWLFNGLMWIGVATLIATLALTLKKLFGRQPSLNEILSGLVSVKTLAEYKEEMRLRCVGIEKQVSDCRHSFDERVNTDLVRVENTFKDIFKRSELRDKEVRSLSDLMSRLQERTESHIRKLDQYDGKFDTLLREVSAAAARGVRQAQQAEQ